MTTTSPAPHLPFLRRLLIAAGAAMLLAGCAGGDLDDGLWITYDNQTSPYDPSFVRTAAETGSFYVEIYGQPFPARMDDQAIAQRIVLPQWLGPTGATTRPGPEVNTNFRAILVFSPGFDGPLTDRACTAPGRIGTAAPRTERLKLAAGFCIGNRMGSTLVAEQGGITGPQDPAFRSMLAQVMLALLPNRNPNRPNGMPPFDRQ